MIIETQPKNFEEEKWPYLSIGYYNGKIILKDDWGDLFYMEEDEEIAPEGTYVSEGMEAIPIEMLEDEEEQRIREIYG
mgnify:CR=1 FL=1|jgi:hypothetical protein